MPGNSGSAGYGQENGRQAPEDPKKNFYKATSLAPTSQPYSSSQQQISKSSRNGPALLNAQDMNGRSLGHLAVTPNNSEPDSLLDLYKHPRSTMVSANNSGQLAPKDQGLEEDDSEHSRWIHRDKLALIESQEMQQAGISIPAPTLEPAGQRQPLNGIPSVRDPSGRLASRRTPSPETEDYEEAERPFYEDPRSPEEIAMDPFELGPAQPIYQHGLRSSSSRIPLSTSSPVPVPHEHLARHTPLPRKRGASGNWNGLEDDAIAYRGSRSRSQSVGSQFLLDDREVTNASPTPDSRPTSQEAVPLSPSKVKPPSKAYPPSGSRKTSRNFSGGTPKASPANRRPGSRAGLDGRPSTSMNRPEGDPPWLATMYKPDPMLPPDQQILPTHAKRMQQEQWVQEGRSGSTYDRDFTPLAVHTQDGLQPPSPAAPQSEYSQQPRIDQGQSQSRMENPPEEQRNASWPFQETDSTPITRAERARSNGSPATANTTANANAGYSTIPKMQNTPPIGSGPMPSPKLPQPMQVQEPLKQKEEESKDKGCCSCVVM
ncbi:hypothetical protein MMC09_003157 [Bachmanniomyces sp. S44760]|nr:hypothetical protein [Bachmanniomyces sp. S44760]